MVCWRPPTLFLLFALLQWVTIADAAGASDPYTSFDAIWSFRESNLIRQQQKKNALSSRQYGTIVSTDVNGTQIPPYTTLYTFDQLIDHDNPSKGTFKQRFWYTWEFYKPGGPIVLTTPGESNAAVYPAFDLANTSITGALAQNINGAVITIEHRFFGESNPYPDLLPEHLTVHTISQAIEDLVYFAQNVKLAFPGGDTDAIRPHKTPWVLVGGSYPGALVSWTMLKQPGVFWAGYSSSGVVQPIADFWQYFEPIRLNMPKNCSADVGRVVDYIDSLIAVGNFTGISQIQSTLGLTQAGPVSNFMSWMTVVLREWRYLSLTRTTRQSLFYDFCDALEVKDGVVASEDGWGLDQAIDGWAEFHRQSGILSPLNGDVVQTEAQADAETSQEDDQAHSDLSWYWMVCNEVGWVQKGPPLNQTGPTIVSRNIQISDTDALCRRRFPGAFETTSLIDRVAATSQTYQGWAGKVDRVFVVNGLRDPWLDATLSATGQNIASTDLRPISLGDGFHCSDMTMASGFYDNTVLQIQNNALLTIKKWVEEFQSQDSAVTVQPIATSSVSASPSNVPSTSTSSTGNNTDTSKNTSSRLHAGVGVVISLSLAIGSWALLL